MLVAHIGIGVSVPTILRDNFANFYFLFRSFLDLDVLTKITQLSNNSIQECFYALSISCDSSVKLQIGIMFHSE